MPTSPSSLTELRRQLRELNSQFLELLARRRETVTGIQQQKTNTPVPWKSYDAQRERDLFAQMAPELSALSSKELLAFSLIMESQAGAPEHYPAWSEGVHLLEQPVKDFQRTNPLLLKKLHPELFAALRLRPNFAFLQDS